MITQDRIYRLALRAGCEPKFYDGALGPRWHCGCTDLRHAMDQQCPVLTEELLYPGPTRAHGLYHSWLETGIDREATVMERRVVTTDGEDVEVEPGAGSVDLFVMGALYELQPEAAMALADMLLDVAARV